MSMDGLATTESAYRAALGTVLDIDVEDVPSFDGLAAELQWDAWLGSLNLGVWRTRPPGLVVPGGYWIFRCQSPYHGYEVHSVVMRAAMVAFDPYPQPKVLTLEGSAVQGECYYVLDPAEPAGRFALNH